MGGGDFSIQVLSDGKSWTIDQSVVPVTRNIDQVLRIAYAAGRQNTAQNRTSNVTPARERQTTILMLRSNPIEMITGLSLDSTAVREQCEEIAAQVSVPAVNADVTGFSFNSRKFTISKDQAGRRLDPDALYEAVMEVLNSDEKHGVVGMEPEPVVASVTQS